MALELGDPALIGQARIGYTRIGVIYDKFGDALAYFEGLSASQQGALIGIARIGYSRIGVMIDKFGDMLNQAEGITTPKEMKVGGSEVVVDGTEVRVDVFTDHFEKLLKRFEG